MRKYSFHFVILLLCGELHAQYEPNWDSLDSRPLPSWYDEAKIGIFLHWGVFSVPSIYNEWFWAEWQGGTQYIVDYMNKNYKPGFTYQEFAKDFTAEFFDANQWAEIFKNSGAQYVVLTSKHHEGYALWPSKYCYSWNSKDVGPGRDLIGELSEAVRAQNLTFGLYHSLLEWYHPIYLADKASNFQQREFAERKSIPELKELVETYKPSIVWSDGDWESPDTYWGSPDFLAWLYNESPVKDTVVTNDRWGSGTSCQHGGFYSCSDRFNPGTLQTHKWENAMTIDKNSWGYRRNGRIEEYMTTSELLNQLVSTISCGGNILMNVGPTKDGIIAPIFQERLRDIGTWLSINGEAMYASKPWTAQNDSLTSNVWYTTKDNAVYATALFWPEGNQLSLGSVVQLFTADTQVVLLGNDNIQLQFVISADSVKITFPDKATVTSEWAYVLKITGGTSSIVN